MDTITDKIRTARKPHRCNWCGGLIQKGEKYRHSVNVDGGDVWSFKEHLKCNSVFEFFAKKHRRRYDGYTNEFFEECVIEELKSTVCKECPMFVHAPPNASARGRCSDENRWHTCIDKLYDALVKDGKIKEAK